MQPPARLAFTWRWDHDPPETATREVWLALEPLASQGMRLLLTQGPYQDTPDDQKIPLPIIWLVGVAFCHACRACWNLDQ